MGHEIVVGSRVMVRLEAEAEDHDWPEGCASFADVFGDADAAEPDEGFEAGTVIRLDEDGETPIALVVWDGLADCAEDADGDGMPSVWAWRVPLFALMPHGSCRSRFERLVDPVRQIATAIGTTADVDPLADLPGLVLAVQAVAQRAESRDIRLAAAEGQAAVAANEVKALRIAFNDLARTNTQLRVQAESTTAGVESRVADAVAAERMAAALWVRERWMNLESLARQIEDGRHAASFDAMLEKSITEHDALTAERGRRIDPVEHARAVAQAFGVDDDQTDLYRDPVWLGSPVRAALLTRVGPDVLAEVER